MARIDWVEQRLEVWALWRARGRRGEALGIKPQPTWRGYVAPVDREPQAIVPVDDNECWRTERAVHQLQPPLVETVEAYYLHGSLAVRHWLGISKGTLSQRLTLAHARLADLLRDPHARLAEVPGSIVERGFKP